MPRKLKVENLSELPEPEARSAVMEEMKEDVVEETPVAKEEVVGEEEVKPKAKAKAIRAKKVKEEVVVEAPVPPPPSPVGEEVKLPKPKRVTKKKKEEEEEAVTEVEEDPAVVEEEVKQPSKVQCPDCGKMVSSKTLKYSHKANCKANKVKEPSLPTNEHSGLVYDSGVKQPCARALRVQQREQRIAQLAMNAF